MASAIGPLVNLGWSMLDDRKLPGGGNIDHLAVGPPGVAVIDAKNWSYPVTVKGDRIYTGRYRHCQDLDRLLEQMAVIESALDGMAFTVTVRPFLVLAGEADRARTELKVRGARIMGVDLLLDKLMRAPDVLSGDEVHEVGQRLSLALAPSIPRPTAKSNSELALEPVAKVHPLFDRTFRFYYLHPWRKGGKHRLYLKSSLGADLGWKDALTQEVVMTCEGDEAKLARAVLDYSTPVGVGLSFEDLPNVPIRIPGGKLLGWLTRARTGVLVGQEWSKGQSRRLYGTLIDPESGTFRLGYVDLKTGDLHPAVVGKLAKNLGSAEKFLRLLADRQPPMRKGD